MMALTVTEELWRRVKDPMGNISYEINSTYSQLKSTNSLLQIYHCMALVRLSLNSGLLNSAVPIDRLDCLNNYFFNTNGLKEIFDIEISSSSNSRLDRTSDDNLSSVFLPLTCALEICDTIKPERISYHVIQYIVNSLIFVSSSMSTILASLLARG